MVVFTEVKGLGVVPVTKGRVKHDASVRHLDRAMRGGEGP